MVLFARHGSPGRWRWPYVDDLRVEQFDGRGRLGGAWMTTAAGLTTAWPWPRVAVGDEKAPTIMTTASAATARPADGWRCS